MVLSGISNRGRLFTRTAMGVALALGVVASGTLVSSPAVAAKKKKDKAPKLEFSKEFVAVAGPAQGAIDKLDANDAGAVTEAKSLLDQAFGAIVKEDDRFLAGSLAVNLGSKLQDPSLQRRGIKAMLASGKTNPADAPRFNAIAGQLAYQAKDYVDAVAYLQRAVDAGFTENNSEVILAEAYISTNQEQKGLDMLKSAIRTATATGTPAPDSWYRRGIASAYKAGMIGEAAEIGGMLIKDHPSPSNVGAAATIVRELGNFGSQETLDLMRLMGRTNGYAEQRDYVEYIQAADPRRHPGEVLDVINAGIAAGKLSASDTFVSDAKSQASGRLAGDKASLGSYANDARKPSASEATVTGAADALLSYGEAAEAEALYTIALGKAGVDAQRTLTRLGIAQVDQGKYAAAQDTFAKVTGKRASIATLWSAYAASKMAPVSAAATTAATQ